ncbi:MAG: FtsX-like permease family protein [Proteobacteria bacterium]|nr:FtsX-like permease family protein [Pseudomonadota bacterium]
MLFGDKAKYLGLVFGVTFATLLITQQVSLFIGLMSRTANAIHAVSEADIWVMDKRVRYIEEVEPMRDVELTNVRSIEGVQWAVPFFKGLATIRMLDGVTQQVQLIGVDNASLVGICHKTILGDRETILEPQHAMIDINGYHFTWPGQPLELGRDVEMNDRRLIINGICDADPTFFTFPILYVSYNNAIEMTPPLRKKMPFVLVKAKEGTDLQALKKRIEEGTYLQALTSEEFAWRSISYVLERTGIPINFGITITLGVIIGIAITAQTFYIFVIENLRYFAAMKAIGCTNRQLIKLVMTQAAMVGSMGYSLGIGLTALFFKFAVKAPAFKGFHMHWEVLIATFVLMSVIIFFSIIFSLRRVFKVDPAIVFRG